MGDGGLIIIALFFTVTNLMTVLAKPKECI